MTLRDVLRVTRRGSLVRSFALGESAVEIGSDPSCDITLHDDRVPARALLVYPSRGSVRVYDLAGAADLARCSILPLGDSRPLGGGYLLTRETEEAPKARERSTDVIPRPPATDFVRALVCGSGSSARAFRIGDSPISIGSATGNGIPLPDRAVSGTHCRLEPSRRGLLVRDLGSANGTFIDGVRIRHQVLGPGSLLRVGRTSLRATARLGAVGEAVEQVAESPAMLAVLAEADRFALLSWPVLVRGDTGVGKEHVARALHFRGPRRAGPFVPLNAGGLARELVESELFGHERGAFTGAARAHRGAFEQAHRGTLFLDEVAELPFDLQSRLLRVLETWRVRRLGSEADRDVNVRLVCATHRDLRTEVASGRFRLDLFYRIHRLVLEIPPLHARPSDIAPLARHFLQRMRPEVGVRELTPDALVRLRSHRWPGNVRELRNVLELAAITSEGRRVDLRTIELALRRAGQSAAGPAAPDMLREALEQYGGNISAAARALGIPRSTFRDRLRSEEER